MKAHARRSILAALSPLAKVAAACLMVLLMTGAPAFANGNGGCNYIQDPTCTVAVGNGSAGGGKGSSRDSGAVTAGCANTDPEGGCSPCPPGVDIGKMPDPQACVAWDHNLFCSDLNPNGLSYVEWEATLREFNCAGSQYTPGSPAVAAQRALASIHFPRPSGDRSPRTSLLYQGLPFTYVNLWTFYWTSPSTWTTLTATARDKNQSATVTARPVELDFGPGDGSNAVACAGPGRSWRASDGNGAPTGGACAFQYMRATSSPVTSTQTILWQITWVGTGNASGEIPSLSTSTSGRLQVLQIQVVNR